MRAWMLLLAAFGLLHALPQAQADDDAEFMHEGDLDWDSEQEEGSDSLEPEPKEEWSRENQHMEPGGETDMPQPPWPRDHHDGYNNDYNPFLRCLQRKHAQLRDAKLKAIAKVSKELKSQANSRAEHLKSVEAEVFKTRCQPQEVCIQVSAEHPVSTNTFYIPKCISVHRCGGCCFGEWRSCISTSQESISKTLIESKIPSSREPVLVSIPFVNHTGCKCSSSLNPRHSINRRASKDLHAINARMVRPHKASPAWCSRVQTSCSSGLSWDLIQCRCVEDQKMLELRGNVARVGVCGVHKVFSEDSCSCVCKPDHNRFKCGPHRVFSEDSCQCVCKNGTNPLICGPHRHLEESTCACVCPTPTLRNSCKPDWDWDKEKCRCVCRQSCPKHTSLNEAACQCECQDQGPGCTRRGMMFDPHSSATGYPAQGGGHCVRATITIITLLLLTKLPERL